MYKNLIPLLVLVAGYSTLLAQGSYHQLLEVDTCAHWIRVTDPPAEVQNETTFALLLLQHAGASSFTADNENFGQLQAINGLGWYEDNESLEIIGDTVYLVRELQHLYATGGLSQVVLFPLQDELTVSDSLAIPFNGSQGGIIFLAARNKLTIDGTLDASGAGYRAGGALISDSQCTGLTSANDYYYGLGNWRGAPKGEGGTALIAGRELGRGPRLNGGGGGNDHNTGGGGGGHYDRGGNGATNETPGLFTCNGNFPGLGGYGLPDEPDRIYFGGGGGSGHSNNNANNQGGNGGGLIYIIADTIIQTANTEYLANGADAPLINGDGGGGGGAGGSLAMRANFLLGAAVTAQLQGGNGASVDNEGFNRCMGPGGGGAGGRFLDLGVVGGEVLPLFNLNGGAGGMGTNSDACEDGELQGSPGQDGFLNSNLEQGPVFPNAALLATALSSSQLNLCGEQEAILSFDYSACLDVEWRIWTSAGPALPLGNEASYSGQNTNQLSVSFLQVDTLTLVPGFVRAGHFFPADSFLTLFSGQPPSAAFSVMTGLPANQASINDQSQNADSVYYFVNGTGPLAGPNLIADFEFGNNVVLQIAENACGTDSLEQNFFVESPATVAAFQATPLADTLCAPVTINFTNTTSGPYDSVFWTFPGGNPGTSNAEEVAVTYFSAGNFTAQLEVFGGFSGSFTSDLNFSVLLPPTANFNFAQVDNSVQVMPMVEEAGLSYLWTFGDGGMSTDSFPDPYAYTEPGNYPIQLVLTNTCGSDSVSQTIFIQGPNNIEELQAVGLSVYPNPVEQYFFVEGRHRGLRLLNLHGQLIRTWSAKEATDRQAYQTTDLAAGVYLLQFKSRQDGLVTLRLIKR